MEEKFRRRRLPHWDLPGATYFVTTCLAGSIPAEGLLDITQYRDQLARREKPDGLSEAEWKSKCWKMTFARRDDWLDRAVGARHLADPVAAKTVVDSMYHFAGKRYDLLSYVVMPSHIHWVFAPRHDWVETLSDDRSPRERIMHTLKSHTGLHCLAQLGRSGTIWAPEVFWQDESYDHCVADEDELERIIVYVERNPVQARLARSPEAWEFSSACDRLKLGIPFGRPLTRPE